MVTRNDVKSSMCSSIFEESQFKQKEMMLFAENYTTRNNLQLSDA